MGTIFETLNNILIALIGITTAIFIFAVTLLGNAIAKSEKEKKNIEEKNKEDFDIKIKEVAEEIKQAERSGKVDKLSDDISKLRKDKQAADATIKEIEKTYSIISLDNTVVYPVKLFSAGIVLNVLSKLFGNDLYISLLFLSLSLLVMGFGIHRIYRCLWLVQEVSLSSEEFEMKKFRLAVKGALEEHSEDQEEELFIRFDNNNDDIRSKAGEKIKINFEVGLSKGKIVRKVLVYFFLSAGFSLPAGVKTWTQKEKRDKAIAGKTTTTVVMNDINIGIVSPSFLNLTVPTEAGRYEILYRLSGEGYKGEREKLFVTVT